MTENCSSVRPAYIDDGVYEGPAANNPTDATLHQIADDIAVVCAFSHVWALRTDDGIWRCSTRRSAPFGPPAVEAVRGWSDDRFATIVYTHGHVDHVGGAGAFLADAERRGARPPRHRRPRERARPLRPVRADPRATTR